MEKEEVKDINGVKNAEDINNTKIVKKPKWYAIYVRSNHEDTAKKLLERANYTVYLPLLSERRRYTDRWVEKQFPLFRSYLFVYIDIRDRFDVLNTEGAGIVRFVSFKGQPAELHENELNAIKEYVEQTNKNGKVSIPDNLKVGQLVRINSGPMRDIKGHLTEICNKQYIVVNIESVEQSILLKIPKSKIEIVSES